MLACKLWPIDCECDKLLDAAITYKTEGTYPSNLSKDRKWAIRKRAERLEIVKGVIFFAKKNGKQRVKIITDPKEQKRILEACKQMNVLNARKEIGCLLLMNSGT